MNNTAFPSHPRIAFAVRTAAQFLQEHDVTALPVDPLKLARSCGVRVKTYTQTANQLCLSMSDVLASFGQRDAFTAVRRKAVIFYNDTCANRERISFSLCHEMGHIALKHFDDFRQNDLSQAQLSLLDQEANIFAANVMAPPAVMQDFPPTRLRSCLFGLSRTAWEVRLQTLQRDIDSLSDDLLCAQKQQFAAWIHGSAAEISFPQAPVICIKQRIPRPARNEPALFALLDNPMIDE